MSERDQAKENERERKSEQVRVRENVRELVDILSPVNH